MHTFKLTIHLTKITIAFSKIIDYFLNTQHTLNNGISVISALSTSEG